MKSHTEQGLRESQICPQDVSSSWHIKVYHQLESSLELQVSSFLEDSVTLAQLTESLAI